jgi:hypothetical protein
MGFDLAEAGTVNEPLQLIVFPEAKHSVFLKIKQSSSIIQELAPDRLKL